MNVFKYTLCYPPGECHPDALLELPPAEVAPSDLYESYEWLTATSVPAVGDVQTFTDSGDWIVTEVEVYLPDSASDLLGVYHAVCTRDGKPRGQREPQSGYTVLGINMEGQTLVEREPGWADWWCGSELSLPTPTPTREVLTFSPPGSPASYDRVVVCRPRHALQPV